MKPTLLILAAGMGSRYGGLKQLDKLGPNGETIMDYSIAYALKSDFGKVVFVIREYMEADFKEAIVAKYAHRIEVCYVFQELDKLPVGYTVHPERVKPYGTAHAILMAKSSINEPFAVINADDFYGEEAFATMSSFLSTPQSGSVPTFSMIGYQLGNTLSEFGTVSRGVCTTNDIGELISITEMTKIAPFPEGIFNQNPDGTSTPLQSEQPVSMNFWGFTPVFFTHLEEMFQNFLDDHQENPTSEFQIPTVINYFLQSGSAKIKVLPSLASWFGVTYREDRPMVVEKLKTLASLS